jgi:putative transposase
MPQKSAPLHSSQAKGVSEARASTARYLGFYKRVRPQSSLDNRTPEEAYFGA